MSMLKEFKDFAVKGNVVDMAVGIIIGAAFGKIVSSFVKDVVMPPIGMITGGVDFSDLAFELQAAVAANEAAGTEAVEAISINYGVFMMAVIDFVIVAFAIFMMVKALNSAKKKEEAKPAAPAAPPKQEVLLEEIRDLLAKG